jgi:hypothetical protein
MATTQTKQTNLRLHALTKLYRNDGNNDNHCNRGLNPDKDGKPGVIEEQEGLT